MGEKEQEITDYLAKNRGWVGKLTSAVSKMDGRCRQMLLTNSKRPLSDYCEKCQKLLRETMEDALK